jgi:dihydrofolate reductase
MQPFPKPKGDKDEMELTSLRKMYKDLKGKPNLPEDIKVVLASAEATLRKEDAKSHKQLVDMLKAARKKLAELDEQWEAYRVQWAAYIDKASQMWLSHVEAFEHGESKFAEKRQEAMQHLQQTRARLHDIHMRTMEEGNSLEGAQVETAQEPLDSTMKLEEQDGSEVESNFTQIKADLTGVVKQVKDTIEEKLTKRRRIAPRQPEQDDVEILEPGDKRTRDSN